MDSRLSLVLEFECTTYEVQYFITNIQSKVEELEHVSETSTHALTLRQAEQDAEKLREINHRLRLAMRDPKARSLSFSNEEVAFLIKAIA